MKSYTVTMEYSVLVQADDLYEDEEELTPVLAEQIALGWLEEDHLNCNPVIIVRDVAGAVVRKSDGITEEAL